MTMPGTGPREGKSCPRCRTMTYRDRERCEHCGHQFRSGLGTGLGATPVDAVLTDEAALNRTMQFTLPPLAPRPAPGADPPLPADPPMDAPPRLRRGRLASALLAFVALALGYFVYTRIAHTAKPSPVGVWETAATEHAPEGRLRLAFQEGGGGAFTWEPGGSAPPVPAPLRWRLDADGRLLLSIAPASPGTDPVPSALITVLDSRPWVWRADRPKHLLVIGPLNLTEKI